ncbi:MAG: hypothetical protein HY801_11275 [Candidatus Lindowbacteria bacterium]|nr:hypothetical protein [Candidatus Lindowbacteria bacterium]
MRVYDFDALRRLLGEVAMARFFYKPDRYSNWEETSATQIGNLTYDSPEAIFPAQRVAFLVLKK